MADHFLAPDSYDAGDFVIRCFRPGDGEALHLAVQESMEHLVPWMPWAKKPDIVQDREARIRRVLADYLTNVDYALGIWQGDEFIGGTGYHLRLGPREWRGAEIGMWIHGRLAGKGYGTRALHGLIAWGFTEWPWERLVWRCDTRNIASERVAQKCGLVLEGTMKGEIPGDGGNRLDMHHYAILKSDWRSS